METISLVFNFSFIFALIKWAAVLQANISFQEIHFLGMTIPAVMETGRTFYQSKSVCELILIFFVYRNENKLKQNPSEIW